MKKRYLVLVLGILLLIGLSASAYATDITLSGDIRVRGELRNNTTDFNSSNADNYAAYDERIGLNIDAKVTPDIEGYIRLESADSPTSPYGYIWGNSGNGAKGGYPYGDSRVGNVYFQQAWILYKGSGLLGIPAGIKVGHQLLKLGNGLFFDHTLLGDDAIVLFANPSKELTTALVDAKFRENSLIHPDDSDAYVGLFNYAIDKNSAVSADLTYLNDQLIAPGGLHFWNLGLRGNGNVSGLGIKADVELQTGKARNAIPTGDLKYTGWAALAGLDYKLEPVTLSLEYAYGSGDKPGTTDKNEGFVTSVDPQQHFTYVYEYRTVNAAGTQFGGITNTQYVKLGAAADLAKDLSGNIGLYWLRANRVNPGQSKSIGTEIDAKVTYKIEKNLVYWVEGGYLVVGGFFDTPTHSSDNAYAVRHGIQLTF